MTGTMARMAVPVIAIKLDAVQAVMLSVLLIVSGVYKCVLSVSLFSFTLAYMYTLEH